jgi:hypothetical protein
MIVLKWYMECTKYKQTGCYNFVGIFKLNERQYIRIHKAKEEEKTEDVKPPSICYSNTSP